MLELNIDLNPESISSLITDAVNKIHNTDHPFRALTQMKKIAPMVVMWETLSFDDQADVCRQINHRLNSTIRNLIKNEVVTYFADQILGGGFRPAKPENADY